MAAPDPPFKSMSAHASDPRRARLASLQGPYQPNEVAQEQQAKARRHAAVALKDPEDFQRLLVMNQQLPSIFRLLHKHSREGERHDREIQALKESLRKAEEQRDSELESFSFQLTTAAACDNVGIGPDTLPFAQRLSNYISQRPSELAAEERDQLLDKVKLAYRARMEKAAKLYDSAGLHENFDIAFNDFLSKAEEDSRFAKSTKAMEAKILARVRRLCHVQVGTELDSDEEFWSQMTKFLDVTDEYIESVNGTDGLMASLENEMKRMASTAYGTGFVNDFRRPLKERMRRYGELVHELVKDNNNSQDIHQALEETLDRLDNECEVNAERRARNEELSREAEWFSQNLKNVKDNA